MQGGDGNKLLSECSMRKEIGQTQVSILYKEEISPGSDGLTAKIVFCNVLVDF